MPMPTEATQQLFAQLQAKLGQLAQDHGLLEEKVEVTGRPLSIAEAIGRPKRQDFPLVKGKEKLMQAVFRGFRGQAFTDMPNNFTGTLQEILQRKLVTHLDMAIFVATMNAVLASLGLIQATVHCQDEEPEDCAMQLVAALQEEFGRPRIALVGFQPAMLQQLALHFPVRLLDLDPERVGTSQFATLVEDGETAQEEVLAWAQLIIATGSTVANGSIADLLAAERPVIFYGTTVAGAAYLMNWRRFCPCASA